MLDATALVVQQDPRSRELLCRRLSDLGVETASTVDPVEARKRLRERHIDLVVCDLDARDEPGFQLAAEVRRWWPETATVGFGSHDDEAVAVIEAGID